MLDIKPIPASPRQDFLFSTSIPQGFLLHCWHGLCETWKKKLSIDFFFLYIYTLIFSNFDILELDFKMFKLALVQALVGSALAGTVIWDGRFNEFSSSTDLNNWSWSNQVGPYQYYIHGSAAVTQYVNLSPSYKNPADTASNQGVKISIDKTAYWNGQNMRRTELIPQTSAGINQGRLYYHFSVKRTNTNAPRADLEHQVNFFESHFTELKYGLLSGASGSSDPTLKWCVSGQTKWSVTFDADVWHNVAYDIDFSANQVSFWHSTGSDPLVLTAGPFSVSTSSNGADWHLGVLRLPMNSDLQSSDVEDWYFSGVYVESGSLNTQIGYVSLRPNI
ncbi:hypothetical protein TWF970_007072 [Orbilia oligospora]|uniref:Glycoside hydrolase 131 catalytic N-terminal domain-containing protein n=1 Tax=Orbilia oligospora TaxID=2813651 RepID=A0A7C8RKL4_ORBOL|nr:hypothetical protein TWF970_007072 [Orbilia oligospora]